MAKRRNCSKRFFGKNVIRLYFDVDIRLFYTYRVLICFISYYNKSVVLTTNSCVPSSQCPLTRNLRLVAKIEPRIILLLLWTRQTFNYFLVPKWYMIHRYSPYLSTVLLLKVIKNSAYMYNDRLDDNVESYVWRIN